MRKNMHDRVAPDLWRNRIRNENNIYLLDAQKIISNVKEFKKIVYASFENRKILYRYFPRRSR